MTVQEVMAAAMTLAPADRVVVAEELLSSVPAPNQEAIDAAWLAEIQRRDAAYQRGEVTAKPLDEVLARLEARVR